MPSSTETGALTIASAFIVASLSIMIVIYTFQWNYFNTKGILRTRKEQIRLKDLAREETRDAFALELTYVFSSMFGLLLNVGALYGFTPVGDALLVSFLLGAFFFVLVFREFSSSLVHLRDSHYARPLWPRARIRPEVRWWHFSRRLQLVVLQTRIDTLIVTENWRQDVSFPVWRSTARLTSLVLALFISRSRRAFRRFRALMARLR